MGMFTVNTTKLHENEWLNQRQNDDERDEMIKRNARWPNLISVTRNYDGDEQR